MCSAVALAFYSKSVINTRAKTEGPPFGGPFALQLLGFEPGSVVNEAPVGLQSRALSEPAGECSNPISRTMSSGDNGFRYHHSSFLPSEPECGGSDGFRGVVHANAAAHVEGKKNIVRNRDFKIAHEAVADRNALRPVPARAFRLVHVDVVDQLP